MFFNLFCKLNLILYDNIRIPAYKEVELRQILKVAEQIADFLHVKVLVKPNLNKKMLLRYF